jgi:16S rRNA (cytidine1402-2'-O)-methyltransferase
MSTVYLIPAVLHEHGIEAIPSYILTAVMNCKVIFAENERTARRYLKTLSREIVIDDFSWHPIHKVEEEQVLAFREWINKGENIAIISEAGCPGIADPGQLLIAVAQELGCTVRPLVGPNSILLALMASGMNGQQFEFTGYLPIDNQAREKTIKELEHSSAKYNSTKIFIETPYRNNQLFESIIKVCSSKTRLCIAVNLTGPDEQIKTRTIAEWTNNKTELHKKPAIFLLYSGI